MVGDGLGYRLPAAESRSHQSEGVPPVEGGTGRTDGLPFRAAGFEQHPVG